MAFHCICVLDSRHAVRMGRYSSTTLCCDTVREKEESLLKILIQLFDHMKY